MTHITGGMLQWASGFGDPPSAELNYDNFSTIKVTQFCKSTRICPKEVKCSAPACRAWMQVKQIARDQLDHSSLNAH